MLPLELSRLCEPRLRELSVKFSEFIASGSESELPVAVDARARHIVRLSEERMRQETNCRLLVQCLVRERRARYAARTAPTILHRHPLILVGVCIFVAVATMFYVILALVCGAYLERCINWQ